MFPYRPYVMRVYTQQPMIHIASRINSFLNADSVSLGNRKWSKQATTLNAQCTLAVLAVAPSSVFLSPDAVAACASTF